MAGLRYTHGVARDRDDLPIIIEAKCIGCWACVMACPYSVLDLDDRNLAVIVNGDACTHFNSCAEVCPTDAIELPWRPAPTG
ncbi:MAG TPA: 4Fe-4S dicluster domain-containing protein [Dehalococcoidia bacterium]|nr:4Fe-4S dicluster domain-containing protein [Dehalococcoidia bacterium]